MTNEELNMVLQGKKQNDGTLLPAFKGMHFINCLKDKYLVDEYLFNCNK